MLRRSLPSYYGEKIVFALLGLIFPSLLTLTVGLFGFHPARGDPGRPPASPSPPALWFLPNLNVRSDAKRGRVEFHRALGAYVDLVALERNAGSGPRQAMEVAAGIGHSWVFRRIGEELARSRWSGQPPWDALTTLADDLGVPELADLADIMRLSGDEGAQVYATLRARSAATAHRHPHRRPGQGQRRVRTDGRSPAACSASCSSPCSSPPPCSASSPPDRTRHHQPRKGNPDDQHPPHDHPADPPRPGSPNPSASVTTAAR